jgi:hypothetical protein
LIAGSTYWIYDILPEKIFGDLLKKGMQFKDVTMEKMGFLKLDEERIYKLHIIHEPGEVQWMRNMHYKQTIVNNTFCQHCENEKINSRFEILDL